MDNANRNRFLMWIAGIVVALLFILISNWTVEKPVPNTIFVKAPEPMVEAFQKTFKKLKFDEEYSIELTEDANKANFIVAEGIEDGELLAYSPIVAIFNSEKDYLKSLTEKGYFVTSDVDSNYEDFDFNKVVEEAISGNCEFKIYYPSKDSDTWDEFYNFMIYTVNDGYYPNAIEDMEQSKKVIEKFLNSKYTEPLNIDTVERINGFTKNSIYLMPYADLVRLYNQSGRFTCHIMYPKTVVYHNYFATFDELGKKIYDSLDLDSGGLFSISNMGYRYLRDEGYNTKYSNYFYMIGYFQDNYRTDKNIIVTGHRSKFNGVEIPGVEITAYEEGHLQ